MTTETRNAILWQLREQANRKIAHYLFRQEIQKARDIMTAYLCDSLRLALETENAGTVQAVPAQV